MYHLNINGHTHTVHTPQAPIPNTRPVPSHLLQHQYSNGLLGTFTLEEVTTPDFKVIYKKYYPLQEVVVQVTTLQPALELYVILNHSMLCVQKEGLATVTQGMYFLQYGSEGHFAARLEPGQEYTVISVQFPLSLLRSATTAFPDLVPFYIQVLRGQVGYFQPRFDLYMKQSLLNKLLHIKACPLTGEAFFFYINTALSSWVLDALHHLAALQPLPNEQALCPRNRRKISAAARFMKDHLHLPLTVQLLSRNVQANRFLLTEGFKAIFHHPIMTYLFELRMKKAVQLLLETNRTEGDIATEVGYTTLQSFSKAFRKRFHAPPGSLRQPPKPPNNMCFG